MLRCEMYGYGSDRHSCVFFALMTDEPQAISRTFSLAVRGAMVVLSDRVLTFKISQ